MTDLVCQGCHKPIVRHSITAYTHAETGAYWCGKGPYRASPDRSRMLSLTTRPTALRAFQRQLDNTRKPRKRKTAKRKTTN
jgi:hypothetical protein